MEPASICILGAPWDELFADGDPLALGKSAERANATVIEEVYSAIAAGDVDAFRRLVAPGATLTIEGFAPWSGHWSGIDEVLGAVSRNFSQVEEQKVAPERMAAQGDQLVLRFREEGFYRPEGRHYEAAVVQWFGFAGGQIASVYQIVSIRFPDGERDRSETPLHSDQRK